MMTHARLLQRIADHRKIEIEGLQRVIWLTPDEWKELMNDPEVIKFMSFMPEGWQTSVKAFLYMGVTVTVK